MADYIYLFENRLTPAQRSALDAVRDVARSHGMPVFLVGGAARDLTSGTPVRDLDFAVQGEVGVLVDELKVRGATVTGENPVLASSYLLFHGGVRAEVAPTLTVTYPKPGIPETQSAAILDDLRRRDFTANAMAISLNEGSYGLLLDPLNGVADIENRELRLVSNYGFIEQPALLLRGARLTERLGWTFEERTAGRYDTAKEEKYIQAMPARDRGYELEELLYEEDPLAALEHLTAEGWSEVLFPAWTTARADRDALERVRDLMGQLDQIGIHIDPAAVFFPLLTAKLPTDDLGALKKLFVRPGFLAQTEGLEARAKELAGQITGRHAAAPSEVWKMLFAAEPEVVLWLAYSSRSGAVQSKLKSFMSEWPQMRQRVPYALMQEMRITPDLPGYPQLLEDLFFALIDGKLDTVEATKAFLEPHSPPAPVVQASPRRRPAKAARSRSKKAAAPVAAAPEASGDESTSEVEGSRGLAGESPVPAMPRAKVPVEAAPVKAVPVKAAAAATKSGASGSVSAQDTVKGGAKRAAKVASDSVSEIGSETVSKNPSGTGPKSGSNSVAKSPGNLSTVPPGSATTLSTPAAVPEGVKVPKTPPAKKADTAVTGNGKVPAKTTVPSTAAKQANPVTAKAVPREHSVKVAAKTAARSGPAAAEATVKKAAIAPKKVATKDPATKVAAKKAATPVAQGKKTATKAVSKPATKTAGGATKVSVKAATKKPSASPARKAAAPAKTTAIAKKPVKVAAKGRR